MARKDAKDRGLFERPEGSGIWWIRYSDQHGREHRERIGSKAAARKAYELRKGEVRQFKFDPEQVTRKKVLLVEDLIKTHMELSENKSWRDDERNARRWSEFFKGIAADTVTAVQLERWKVDRAKTAAKATVCRELSFIRRVFTRAVDSGLLKSNPAAKVEFYKLNNARDRFLEEDEERRLEAVMQPKHFRLVMLAIQTGMRRGEQFGARLEDVDLRQGFLKVQESKNGEARRVLLNSQAKSIVKQLIAEAKALGSIWLIPSQTGKSPLCANNFVKRVFEPALEQAEVEGFTWHDLRHTYGSRLAMAGVPLRTIQVLMGHKSIRTTERYAHLSPDHKVAAVEVLASRSYSQQPPPEPSAGTGTEEATGTKTGTSRSLRLVKSDKMAV